MAKPASLRKIFGSRLIGYYDEENDKFVSGLFMKTRCTNIPMRNGQNKTVHCPDPFRVIYYHKIYRLGFALWERFIASRSSRAV